MIIPQTINMNAIFTFIVLCFFYSSYVYGNAVGTEVNYFNPNVFDEHFFSVHSGETLPEGVWAYSVFGNYSSVSIDTDTIGIGSTGTVLYNDSFVTMDLGFGYAVLNRLFLSVNTSFSFLADPEVVGVGTSQLTLKSAGLNDVRLAAKYGLIDSKLFNLAFVFTGYQSLYEENVFSGEETGPGFIGELAADFDINKTVKWALNIGYRSRSEGTPNPLSPFPIIGSNNILFSTGVSKNFGATRLVTELYGDMATDAKSDLEDPNLEWAFGLKSDLSSRTIFNGGGSFGLIKNRVPDWRVFFGLNIVSAPIFTRKEKVNEQIKYVYLSETEEDNFDPNDALSTKKGEDKLADDVTNLKDSPSGEVKGTWAYDSEMVSGKNLSEVDSRLAIYEKIIGKMENILGIKSTAIQSNSSKPDRILSLEERIKMLEDRLSIVSEISVDMSELGSEVGMSDALNILDERVTLLKKRDEFISYLLTTDKNNAVCGKDLLSQDITVKFILDQTYPFRKLKDQTAIDWTSLTFRKDEDPDYIRYRVKLKYKDIKKIGYLKGAENLAKPKLRCRFIKPNSWVGSSAFDSEGRGFFEFRLLKDTSTRYIPVRVMNKGDETSDYILRLRYDGEKIFFASKALPKRKPKALRK